MPKNKLFIHKILICILIIALSTAMFTGCNTNKTVTDNGTDEYITLGDYIGIEADQTKVEITDDDIDEYIEEETEEYVNVDREIKTGDYVVINYTSYFDGEESEDWSDEDIGIVIGQCELYVEFDKALLGAKAGDSVDVDVDFSAYDETVEASETKCTVDVVSVYEIVSDEITDEYVKDNTDYETVEEYRAAIYQELYDEAYESAVEEMKYNAWQTAMDNAVLNGYSDDMYNDQYEVFISDIQYYAEMFGYDDVETFMDEWGYTDDIVKESVEEYIKQILVCQAIANAENIEVSDEEYQEGLEELAAEYQYDDVESFEADYDTDDIQDYLLLEKVMDFIADNAVINEVEADDEELSDLS